MTDTRKGKIWQSVSEGLAPRTAKQCRERYVNNIDPDRKKGNWTAEEDEIIFKLVDDLGTKWSKISARKSFPHLQYFHMKIIYPPLTISHYSLYVFSFTRSYRQRC